MYSKIVRRHSWPTDLFEIDPYCALVAAASRVNNNGKSRRRSKIEQSSKIENENKRVKVEVCTCYKTAAPSGVTNRDKNKKYGNINCSKTANKSKDESPSTSRQFQTKFKFLNKKLKGSRNRERDKNRTKDYVPTSNSNENLGSRDVKCISPTGKSDSSITTTKSDSNNYFCNSTNNSGDSHTQSQSKNGTNIGRGNANVTTNQPIRVARGTATGALSLHVQSGPNGDVKKVITLWQNYYPEGQWGWIVVFCALLVQSINHGIQLGFSTFGVAIGTKFHIQEPALLGFLGAVSSGVSLFLSPIWVSLCKRKSTRLAAVFGGLVASLGCLFTSFASQFHQLFLSYGLFIGVGVGLTRDASSLMVGQYFKRKRDLVEIIIVSGSGLGILLMSVSIRTAINSFGWRLGLQLITGSLLVTFFLGTCYRSASLYHPQRRAILHLKNQKRKVKEKEKREEQPPFLDFSCLNSKTLQILLLSSAFTAFGISTPLFYLAIERENEPRLDESLDSSVPLELSLAIIHVSIGISWIVGCFLFGLIVIQKNQECRVSKQYLCQITSVLCAITIIALATTEGFNSLVIFSSAYGFTLGGYNYALKVYTYERVRARHFPRAWSFIQSSQAIPIVLGIPFAGYLNVHLGWKSGYYLSALSVMIGSALLFLSDVRKRRLSRRKTLNSSMKTYETNDSTSTPKVRRLSFAFPVDQMSPQSKHDSGTEGQPSVDPVLLAQELTCISEEGIADIDFQDIYFEEWAEYFGGDCITSCNKVENCLVSEFDPDYASILDRRSRRWSAGRPNSLIHSVGVGSTAAAVAGGIVGLGTIGHTIGNSSHQVGNLNSVGDHKIAMRAPKEIPIFRNHSRFGRTAPSRSITVIDEASV